MHGEYRPRLRIYNTIFRRRPTGRARLSQQAEADFGARAAAGRRRERRHAA